MKILATAQTKLRGNRTYSHRERPKDYNKSAKSSSLAEKS